MSTLPNQARISPSWKQEVNQRVAAHKNRKLVPASEPDLSNLEHHTANQRAAAAAARVAARFANAPRYNEFLEEEARAAVRAAEAVSRAALEAQAAAESVLAELEAAKEAESLWELHDAADSYADERSTTQVAQTHSEAGPAPVESARAVADLHEFKIRWEPDMPALHAGSSAVNANPVSDLREDEANRWRENMKPEQDWPGADPIQIVEPAMPIPANLIEFPREIVATRKVRPRRIEGPYGTIPEKGAQLSIFEVDPEAISVDPAAPAVSDAASSAWARPDWAGMQLDAQPETEFAADGRGGLVEEPRLDALRCDSAGQAPLQLRLMAAVVDFALMLGALAAAAMVAGHNAKGLPSLRATEAGAAAGFIVICALYKVLFCALRNCTPGMMYAGISLSTFEGSEPTRAQRFRRLAALLLSVLPVGVGVMWAIFDDDHLSWHDRLSSTYLRRN